MPALYVTCSLFTDFLADLSKSTLKILFLPVGGRFSALQENLILVDSSEDIPASFICILLMLVTSFLRDGRVVMEMI